MLHIAVVGAGPAGLVAAEALASRGLRVTLVERAPQRVRPCSGLVSSELLAAMQWPDALVAGRVQELALYSPSSRVAFLPLSGLDRAAHVIDPQALAMYLRDRARTAGVTFVEGHFERFCHGEGDYPELAIRLANGERQTIACDVVIGADGASSRVAKAMGAPALELGVVYQERLAAGGSQGTSAEAMQVHFGRKVSADAYGYLLPRGDELLVAVATQNRYGKRVWDMLAELKRRAGSALDGARPLGRESYCYALAPRTQLVYDRVMLVGEAAGLGAPATRDGLYYACRSALLAAQTILDHQHVPVSENLRGYERAFKAEHGKVLAGLQRLETRFLGVDRRREVLIDLAWDRAAARAAVEAFHTKRPFAPTPAARLRLEAKTLARFAASSMGQPRRGEPEGLVRALPDAPNYLDLALRSPTGPLRVPTGPLSMPTGPLTLPGEPGPYGELEALVPAAPPLEAPVSAMHPACPVHPASGEALEA